MQLYQTTSYDAKHCAQRNLSGRTHYVDDDTLRFHKSRILETHILRNGLIFGLVESCALDMNNTKRGFRFVLFDLWGEVISRPNLDETFKTSLAARKAMYKALEGINNLELCKKGLEHADKLNAWNKTYTIEQINRALSVNGESL